MAKLNREMFGHLAESVQKNIKDEAEAIESYQQMMNEINSICSSEWMFKRTIYENGQDHVEPTPTATADKKMLKVTCDQLKEIIADEMNHIKRLNVLYETMTGIKAKES